MTSEETLKHLLPLILKQDEDYFLSEAKRAKSDNIKKITIPWLTAGNKLHGHWDNTVSYYY